jgi:carbamoyltransferase
VTRPTYVLGTGLSHDGSAVLLRDGAVAYGIEKERLTRVKHDGGNDRATVRYCLDAEQIDISDVALVVQCGLFDAPGRADYDGPRAWETQPGLPVMTISHHLAHAFSAVGTAPFDEFDILVIDGCGSPRDRCRGDRARVELSSGP